MVYRDDKFTEKGRKGLDFWSIFVLGMLRLVCNWSYDMLENMANNHRDIRHLIGLNDWLDADKKFSRTALHEKNKGWIIHKFFKDTFRIPLESVHIRGEF